MKTRIIVNRHIIAANKKNGTRDPALHAVNYKGNTYGHRIAIDGPSIAVYDPENPLSCGATAWIETRAKVLVVIEREFDCELKIVA